MIKSTLARLLLITAGLLLPQLATAEDELLLYVFQGGQPQRSATITIDGEVAGTTRLDGSFTADLNAGGHVVAVDASGDQRVVRFALESGQLADLVIELAPGSSPLVDVYGSRESAPERRDQPKADLPTVLMMLRTKPTLPTSIFGTTLRNRSSRRDLASMNLSTCRQSAPQEIKFQMLLLSGPFG